MDYTIQLPLSLDLASAAQTETFEAFIGTDVGKHRLDHRQALTVDCLALVGVDTVFHPVGVVGAPCRALDDERHLPAMALTGIGGVRVTQALLF